MEWTRVKCYVRLILTCIELSLMKNDRIDQNLVSESVASNGGC